MTYVTIDYSLNSPGICVFHKNKYTFISYLKPKSGTKKEQALQAKMAKLSDVIFQEQPDFTNNLDYAGIVGTTIQLNGLPVDTFMTGNLDAQGNDVIDANLVNATGNLTGDVKGSVFADDSSVMVDAVNFAMFSDAMTLTPLSTEPAELITGMLVAADGVNWDPATKSGTVPYPVFYDGVAWNALY